MIHDNIDKWFNVQNIYTLITVKVGTILGLYHYVPRVGNIRAVPLFTRACQNKNIAQNGLFY